MSGPVEFLYDFGSPNAYFCHAVIPGIEARAGITFGYKPILLGGLFKLTNNRSPVTAFAEVKNKLEYQRLEIRRFVKKHGLTKFKMNPHFPVNTLHIMRGAVAAQRLGVAHGYNKAMFAGVWEEGLKLDDPEVIGAALAKAGIDARALMALSQEQSVKDELAANTQAAFERGAFGAPTFFIGREMWFGKETLRDVEAAALG